MLDTTLFQSRVTMSDSYWSRHFMSTLLKQVYKLLGIKSLRTTPYHPQTDGLTEHFNQTLKQMLLKFISESGTSGWPTSCLHTEKFPRPPLGFLLLNYYMDMRWEVLWPCFENCGKEHRVAGTLWMWSLTSCRWGNIGGNDETGSNSHS